MSAVAKPYDRDDRPREDHIVVLNGSTWADYQRLMEIRGDRSSPRLAFLEGRIEIMSPSQDHETIKSILGCLVEAWCLERGVEFSTCGSWTLEDKEAARGIEPDECFIFGNEPKKARRPDLAIEVVWTSGGLDKLEVYKKLGVREVWFWRKGVLTPWVLKGESYEAMPSSEALAGIDLVELATFLDRPTTSAAIRAYRDALRAKSP